MSGFWTRKLTKDLGESNVFAARMGRCWSRWLQRKTGSPELGVEPGSGESCGYQNHGRLEGKVNYRRRDRFLSGEVSKGLQGPACGSGKFIIPRSAH